LETHLLAIPLLAAPAITFCIDDAGAGATATFVFHHEPLLQSGMNCPLGQELWHSLKALKRLQSGKTVMEIRRFRGFRGSSGIEGTLSP
jgi:alpha-glucuronidase